MALSFIGMGLAGQAISVSPSAALAAVFCFVSGMTNAPSVVARQVLLQRNIPRELRGRVHSAFFVSRDLMYVLGMAAVGLADVIDVRWLIAVSCGVIGTCGLVMLRLPRLGSFSAVGHPTPTTRPDRTRIAVV